MRSRGNSSQNATSTTKGLDEWASTILIGNQGKSSANSDFQGHTKFHDGPLVSTTKRIWIVISDKGHFPHMYTRRENLDIQLPNLPEIEQYQPDWMKRREREQFLRWYAENRGQPFCLRDQLIEYCSNDVRILMEASLRFRELLIETTQLDPFIAACTCAGLALKTFRVNHLPPNTMVHSPEFGLRRGDRASAIALRYIRLWERQHPEMGVVQTAKWAIGERPHPEDSGKRLDGFVQRADGQRPLAIEFLGW